MACAPGVLGSSEVLFQASAACAGPCPVGYFCGSSASDASCAQAPCPTSVPEPCPAGNTCPLGSVVPIPCPVGTYANATGLSGLDQCNPCPAGAECPAGSAQPIPCPKGFANAVSSSGCLACSSGTYSNETGATECKTCAPGFWCPIDRSIQCPENTCARSLTTERASREGRSILPAPRPFSAIAHASLPVPTGTTQRARAQAMQTANPALRGNRPTGRMRRRIAFAPLESSQCPRSSAARLAAWLSTNAAPAPSALTAGTKAT